MFEGMFDRYGDWHTRAVKHICQQGFDFNWAGDDIAGKDRLLVAMDIAALNRQIGKRVTLIGKYPIQGA
jgi:hypothetical protein